MKVLFVMVAVLLVASYFFFHHVSEPFKAKPEVLHSVTPPVTAVLHGDKDKDVVVTYQFQHRPAPAQAVASQGAGGASMDPVSNTVTLHVPPEDKSDILAQLKAEDVRLSRIGIHVIVIRVVVSGDDEFALNTVLSHFKLNFTAESTLAGPGLGVALSGLQALFVQQGVKVDMHTLIETDSVLTQGTLTKFQSTSEQLLNNTVTTQVSVSTSVDRRPVGLFLSLTPFFLEGEISLRYTIDNQTPDSAQTVQETSQDGETRLTRTPLVMMGSRRQLNEMSHMAFLGVPLGSSVQHLIQQDIFCIVANDPGDEPVMRAIPIQGINGGEAAMIP